MLRLFKDWLIRKCILCILAISYEQGKNHKKQFTTGQVYSDRFLHFLVLVNLKQVVFHPKEV